MDHLIDDSDRLKPCPFCQAHDPDGPNDQGYYVECGKCGASTNLRFSCGEDARPLLMEQWNCRTHEICQPETLPRRRHGPVVRLPVRLPAVRRKGRAMKPLKPCPFCLTEGAKLIELWDLFDAGIVAHIHCEHCGADGPSIYCEVGGVDAALFRARSMWNGRAEYMKTPNV